MSSLVFLNGEFIPAEEATASVLGPGFLQGYGLFETMRSYRGKIAYLDAHLRRIEKSSGLLYLRLPYSAPGLKRIIAKAVKINGFSDCCVRLTVWKGERETQTLIIAKKYRPFPHKKYLAGFRVWVSPYRQNEFSLLTQIKSTSRLFYEFVYRQAKDKGFDEAIILNSRGDIAEGSRSNIFLVKAKVLFTPALSCGCLAGVTRRVAMDLAKKYNIEVCEGKFTMRDFYAADEVFLTNSLMGIMPVNRCKKLTRFLIKKYNSLLS